MRGSCAFAERSRRRKDVHAYAVISLKTPPRAAALQSVKDCFREIVLKNSIFAPVPEKSGR